MNRLLRRPRAAFPALVIVVSVLASGWLTAAPAYADSRTVQLRQAAAFTCTPQGGTTGFGSVTYTQSRTRITASFILKNAPKNDSVSISIGQCDSSGNVIGGFPDSLGSVTTNGSGSASKTVSIGLKTGAVSYFICLDDNTHEWGTDPVRVLTHDFS